MPHFFVDDSFSDSKEVLSIPARHRLAAVGLWTLCGSWSAGKLTNGEVPNEVLKRLAARPALVAALIESTLWERTATGIRITNWSKWQRTREQVESYRAWDAERKRKRRAHARNAATSDNEETSPRDSDRDTRSRPQGSPRTPIPTPERTTTYVQREGDLSSGGISATPGADLVRKIIPKGHPAATLTSLRLQASELLNTGTDSDTVADALRLWVDKPGVGIGRTILASMCSEVIKGRDPHARNGKPVHKLRAAAELAAQMRAEENAQLVNQPRKEIKQ